MLDESATKQLLSDLADALGKNGNSIRIFTSRLNHQDPANVYAEVGKQGDVDIQQVPALVEMIRADLWVRKKPEFSCLKDSYVNAVQSFTALHSTPGPAADTGACGHCQPGIRQAAPCDGLDGFSGSAAVAVVHAGVERRTRGPLGTAVPACGGAASTNR